ncbi:hypothetical protein KR074_011163 [Drosophila pseudoananassae]|nr:hypothetical protein KR074_011163 [Drosophila pseudoananassae]
MAHNSSMFRKIKAPRTDLPSIYQHQPQPQDDMGPTREKAPKLNSSRDAYQLRRCKATKNFGVVEDSSKTSKVIVHDLNRMEVDQHIEVKNASKHTFRTMGGGGAAAVSATTASGSQKFQSKVSLTNQASKTTRSSIVTSNVKKQQHSPDMEYKDSKVIKEVKEIKESKEARGPKETKPHKDKEAKTPKGNHSHRSSRHTTANRTKTYFDKYLKFAFDLSTPEGVKQLEDHFFPTPHPVDQKTTAPSEQSRSAESNGN